MVLAIIQARLTSTRLPRKILKKIAGKTIIQHVIDRVKKAKEVDKVVVAAPHKIPCKGVDLFIAKHTEHNVLERFRLCALRYGAGEHPLTIVRITSDCPLVDPEIIDFAVKYYFKSCLPYVIFAPVDGLDVEVFASELLTRKRKLTRKEDMEHVTPSMKKLVKMSVDTKEDYDRVKHWLEMGLWI